jgi:putative addiction module component (TIGR02574 family)
MPVSMKDLGLDKLSPDDRLALAQELWASVEAESGLTAAQKADLDRRIAAYEADPTAGSSWEEVEARLLGGRP